MHWHENDGNQRFSPHSVDFTTGGATSYLSGIHASDFDGDGDVDLFAVSYRNQMIAWLENDGNQQFT
jgi:hypothetical protein